MDPYDRSMYRYKPRINLQHQGYSWYPQKTVPRGRKLLDYQHQLSPFTKTGHFPSDFIVSPEWVSEDFHQPLPFQGRRWKPHPWEFQGARYWPHGTLENKLDEERNIKALVTPRDIPSEFHPVEGYERHLTKPGVTLHLTPRKAPWRPKTSWAGYLANDSGGVYGDSKAQVTHRPQSVSFSRHVKDLQHYNTAAGYEEYFDDQSPYNSHHPDDVELTSPASAVNPTIPYANATRPIPLVADEPYENRPRFDRPYLNMVNAMWIGSKYTTSPAQN